ncbi:MULTISPECIES: ATP-dependent DNA helicase [Cysteiniphilum]|uniref:Putative ATP-dependent helicase n=1 Tax=Cysteiniphilum litorale TaxID=2056700 RepID=A0A8J3E850_9GAMM|nr:MULTISPECIES: helicase C-terminal domain-containing protein [Cysteiniphilum]GGF91195.1 putative ATP-dependent helicase [Cysteiniphilum litorale]
MNLTQHKEIKLRSSQLSIIDDIHQSLRNNEDIAFEAPTGTGKTIAYLYAGFILAKEQKRKLIVSTSTNLLQDQIIKDIPKLEQLCKCRVNIALLKGKQHYMCLQKFSHNASLHQTDLEKINTELDSGWNLERNNLKGVFSKKFINDVFYSFGCCIGSFCQYADYCPAISKNQLGENADIIVINHDLLLCELMNDKSFIVRNSNDYIYVIDEAHTFSSKAIAKTQCKLSLEALLRNLIRLESINGVDKMCALKDVITHTRSNMSILLKDITTIDENTALKSNLNKIHLLLANKLKEMKSSQLYIKAVESTNYLVLSQMKKLEDSLETLDVMLNNEIKCIWHDKDYIVTQELTATRIMSTYVSPILKGKSVWCSATLTVNNSFNYFKHQVSNFSLSNTKRYKSSFDYSTVKLLIPKISSGPNALIFDSLHNFLLDEEYNAKLYLFTSRKDMLEAYSYIDDINKKNIIIQDGVESKEFMIQKHKDNIDSGNRSVIFGLQTFFEGVDLPGKYLNEVLIYKLPFESNESPINRALLKYNNRNLFADKILPEAAIRLKQMCGRLLRSDKDYGRLIILDNRLINAKYSSYLLASIPEYVLSQF